MAPSVSQSQQAPPQRPPGAGDALRDIQDKPQAPAPTPPTRIDVVPEAKRAIRPIPGLKIDVKAFRITGLTEAKEERLQAVVQKFIGPDRTFDDLQAAAEAVSEELQREGFFVALAYLPEQKIDDGVVEIAVLEGRLASIKLEMDKGVAVSRHIIEGLLSSLAPGTVMHRDRVERALFLVSDLRAVNVRSIVEPGPSPGTSDLTVQITPGRRVDGFIEFDNHGSRFAGQYRLGGGLNINSPAGRGDLLSLRGLFAIPEGSKELNFGRISYLTPVGAYGTKLGAAYSALYYHLGTDEFEALNERGRAEVVSLFGLHPITRTRNFNLFGQAGVDLRDFHDVIGVVPEVVVDKRTRVGMLGLVGDSRDALLGGGINNFSLAYTAGDLDIRSPAFAAADQSTGRNAQGHYSRINGSLSRLNAVVGSTVLYVSYSFQLASKNLDVSEKLSLGGPYAVRAYAPGEAASDDAHLGTVELRHGLAVPKTVPGYVILSAFYDIARGKQSHDPLPFEANNTRTLQGIGLGVTWGRQDDFLVRGMIAWRLSGAPVSDRADRQPRLFFQLTKNL
jgi:hemolysin activation/secretion protein